ncbi:hypothetical protein RHOSPDRAFT_27825 [Rhodotorula sp. JG-1b]|nr:hypothetical protein RHOSPDRAFT_27825 [Rhodotorula sp. JG-1b]
MLPTSKRRANLPSLPLPASHSSIANHRTYAYEDKDKDKDKDTLKRTRYSHRRKLIAVVVVVVAAVALLLSFAWALIPPKKRIRTTRGSKVVARDWGHALRIEAEGRGGALVDEHGVVSPPPPPNQPVLILCPMRNAIEHIWHFFHLVDSLTYPRHLLHLAILVSDTTDGTYTRALELADERQYDGGGGAGGKRGRYGRISVYQKDFAADQAADDLDGSSYAGANIGQERHKYEAQVGRRKLLGKSRTWLLTSALAPEIDWVLWADVDVVDYEPTLLERLMEYAEGSSDAATQGADVVVPNCVWKTYNEMGAYDRNNWVETPESLAMKAALPGDQVLIEGYKDHPTYRFNLASLAPSHPSQLSPHNAYLANPALLTLSSLPSYPFSPDLTLPSALALALALDTTATAPAPIPETLDLDGVGGCAALVRAEVHREGAIFPAWPPVDHQLETEGFAQMVKALRRGRRGGGVGGRGRLLGLPRYYVYHGLYG